MSRLNPDWINIQELIHYKERLENNINDKEEILECLYDLFDVEINTQYLQVTLIGKTVNAFRNDKEVGLLAQNLVRKWKNIVIDENDGSDSDSDEGQVPECASMEEKEEDSGSSSADDSDIEITNENICPHPQESDSDDKLVCQQNEVELINQCKKSCLEIKLTRINVESPQVLSESTQEVTEDRNKLTSFVTEVENFCEAEVAEKGTPSPTLSKIKDLEEGMASPSPLKIKDSEGALKTAYVDLSAFQSLNELVLKTSLAKSKESRPNCTLPCKTKDVQVEPNICPKVR